MVLLVVGHSRGVYCVNHPRELDCVNHLRKVGCVNHPREVDYVNHPREVVRLMCLHGRRYLWFGLEYFVLRCGLVVYFRPVVRIVPEDVMLYLLL